jgi:hypothetical protein
MGAKSEYGMPGLPIDAAVSTITSAQPAVAAAVAPSPPTAAAVAVNFAKALLAQDVRTAAVYVTARSRADFLALMDLGERLKKARRDLQAALDAKFKRTPVRRSHVDAPADAVPAAEVVDQRVIGPTLVELDVRLSPAEPNDLAQLVTWCAVQADGEWKIEWPACAKPDVAAALKRRLETALDSHSAITASITRGEFANSSQARAAFVRTFATILPGQLP